MTTHSITPEQSAALVTLFERAADIHAVFGAPGDYGYGTKEGQALYALSKALVAAQPIITSLVVAETCGAAR